MQVVAHYEDTDLFYALTSANGYSSKSSID